MNELSKLNLQYAPTFNMKVAFAIVVATLGLLGTVWCVLHGHILYAMLCAALVSRATIGNPVETQLTKDSQERLIQYIIQSGETTKDS